MRDRRAEIRAVTKGIRSFTTMPYVYRERQLLPVLMQQVASGMGQRNRVRAIGFVSITTFGGS